MRALLIVACILINAHLSINAPVDESNADDLFADRSTLAPDSFSKPVTDSKDVTKEGDLKDTHKANDVVDNSETLEGHDSPKKDSGKGRDILKEDSEITEGLELLKDLLQKEKYENILSNIVHVRMFNKDLNIVNILNDFLGTVIGKNDNTENVEKAIPTGHSKHKDLEEAFANLLKEELLANNASYPWTVIRIIHESFGHILSKIVSNGNSPAIAKYLDGIKQYHLLLHKIRPSDEDDYSNEETVLKEESDNGSGRDNFEEDAEIRKGIENFKDKLEEHITHIRQTIRSFYARLNSSGHIFKVLTDFLQAAIGKNDETKDVETDLEKHYKLEDLERGFANLLKDKMFTKDEGYLQTAVIYFIFGDMLSKTVPNENTPAISKYIEETKKIDFFKEIDESNETTGVTAFTTREARQV